MHSLPYSKEVSSATRSFPSHIKFPILKHPRGNLGRHRSYWVVRARVVGPGLFEWLKHWETAPEGRRELKRKEQYPKGKCDFISNGSFGSIPILVIF